MVLMMSSGSIQIKSKKQEFRWKARKIGRRVVNLCSQFTFVLTLTGVLMMTGGVAHANPAGGNVVSGQANINTSGSTTNIHQQSNHAIIEWQNFDIGAGETVQFFQNSTSSIALNRVVNSDQATAINGNLLANGRVLVINPNGVLIGATGNVDVGGFVASSADIDNQAFMNAKGAMSFNRAGKVDAAVINNGKISVKDAGISVLVAPTVRNNGIIQGNMAKLHMGAGDTFGVDLYGDGLLHLAVDSTKGKRTISAENAGSIVANAGQVVMTAATASNVVNSVINTSGVIEAKGLVAKGGEIILTGGGAAVKVSGKVDASGKTGGGKVKIGGDVQGQGTLAKAKTVDVDAKAVVTADAETTGRGGTIAVWSDDKTTSRGRFSAKGGSQGGDGGFVETSSKMLLDVTGTQVNTSAAHGSYGVWLLDPATYTVDASNVGTINNAQSNVFLVANDNIWVNTDINIAASGVGLYLHSHNVTVNGNITLNNAELYLNASGGTLTTNNGLLQTNGGAVNLGGYDINLSSNISSGGGNVRLSGMGGDIVANNISVDTKGGDFNASVVNGGNKLRFENSKLFTYGGDVYLTGLVNADISTAGSYVNTTGGTTLASVNIDGFEYAPVDFKQTFGSSGFLEKNGNAGDVIISSNGGSVSGPGFCISAGGSTCVAPPANNGSSVAQKATNAVRIADLNRPVVSLANKVIVLDSSFEPIETRTTDVDMTLRYQGNSGASRAGALAALEPAAGAQILDEDLATLEPAAGGDNPAAETAPQAEAYDVACANDFLGNVPCKWQSAL